ncbi:MAG: hypothetical protein WBG85_05930 [Rhodanobacter sp.]
MFKIDGLDKITRQLRDTERAIATIEGELGSVSFSPSDPESIEQNPGQSAL